MELKLVKRRRGNNIEVLKCLYLTVHILKMSWFLLTFLLNLGEEVLVPVLSI